ncbi:MAG: c-type cytochrome [Thiobacillus sp.]|nr:c-type cytochrome [Thiobacillus sp.]
MKFTTAFLIVASATSLLACGKSEDVSAPATELPVAEATQVEPAPLATAEPAPVATTEPATPVVEPLPPEAPPAAAIPAQPEPKAAQPAASKPAAVQAVEASPAAAAPAAAAADLVHGQQIYRQACAFCHDRGVAGAPKTGDAAAWNARLAQGMDALYTAAIRGKGAMPAKGGNPSLSDTDVNAAVDYMIAQH